MPCARGCARSPRSSRRPARSTSRTEGIRDQELFGTRWKLLIPDPRSPIPVWENGMVERRDVIGGGLVAQQRTYLKANQKFPDYMDVGIDVWERMHDWHVRTRQPLNIIRTNDGRYGMVFGVTTLMLLPQQVGGYISWGYDNR